MSFKKLTCEELCKVGFILEQWAEDVEERSRRDTFSAVRETVISYLMDNYDIANLDDENAANELRRKLFKCAEKLYLYALRHGYEDARDYLYDFYNPEYICSLNSFNYKNLLGFSDADKMGKYDASDTDGRLKIFDICFRVKGAGPSPMDNYRTEIYFAGCDKAKSGDPCKNCCNPMVWDRSKAKPLEVDFVFQEILKHGLPYITFVGGEPSDQRAGVVELARRLKALGFHIVMFSWHSRQWFKDNWRCDELSCFDVIITEPYVAAEKIYDYSKDDGIHNAIGSGNQEIWLEPGAEDRAFKAAEINSLEMDVKNTMRINLKNGASYKQQEQ